MSDRYGKKKRRRVLLRKKSFFFFFSHGYASFSFLRSSLADGTTQVRVRTGPRSRERAGGLFLYDAARSRTHARHNGLALAKYTSHSRRTQKQAHAYSCVHTRAYIPHTYAGGHVRFLSAPRTRPPNGRGLSRKRLLFRWR